jgi:hypothetical protein
MNCSDMEELLSAYANNECSRTQKEFVEEHVTNCADCREKLAGLMKVRRQLISLRETPTLYDIKEETMLRIKAADTRKPVLNWMRPALISFAIVAILLTLIILQPWSSSPDSQVMAKAHTAITDLQSYRASLIHISDTEGITSEAKVEIEFEFTAPDHYHFRQTGDTDNLEFIIIGDEQYYKDSYVPIVVMESLINTYSSMISRETTLDSLDNLINIQTLPDEPIDGTQCFHYRGDYDIEKQISSIQKANIERGLPPLSDEELEQLRSHIGTTTIELWIGIDDYLLRQMRRYNQGLDNNGQVQSSTLTLKYYDFDQPITIEAPVDSNGELLPDWTSTLS